MKKVLLVIGVIALSLFLTGCDSNENYTQSIKKNISSKELYELFSKEGYRYINASTDDGVDRIIFDNNEINLTKINSRGYVEEYPKGITYYFSNESINKETVTLYGKGDRKQYKAYKKWLVQNGLETKDIIELLDYIEENIEFNM